MDTGLNMYLFAQNKGGSAALHSKVRCYGVKIWQDGVLVRDFRPCVRDGKAGLFDEVSRGFFFAYGGDLLPPVETPDAFVQYVESNGTQYVDTGIKGRCNTKADMTLQLMKVADTTFLGARNDNGDTRFLLCHGNSRGLVCTGHVSFDWGDKYLSTSHPDRLIGSIMHVRNPWILFDGSLMLHDYDSAMVLPMTLFLGALLFSDICKQRGIAVRKVILRQDAWFRCLAFAVSTAVVLLFGVWGPGFSEANFIYFQF